MKFLCRNMWTHVLLYMPAGIWGILLPRAVKVSLSRAQLLMSKDFSAGKNRSRLRRFSEELPIFLLADKSNS